MTLRYPLCLCLLILAFGCSKDKYSVSPGLRIKSYTANVPFNGDFNAVLVYSQKNGKLNGDSLLVIRHRYNQTPPTIEPSDTFFTQLLVGGDPANPDVDIPATNYAEFHFTLPYTVLHTIDHEIIIDGDTTKESDSLDLAFVLTDLSGRASDTVKTGKIVVKNQ